MKVLHINKYYSPVIGGVEKHLALLCQDLREKVDLEVLVCNTLNRTESVVHNGVKVKKVASLGKYFSMPVSLLFPYYLGQYNPDLVHMHLPFPLGDISYLLSKPNGKLVVTWQSDILRQKLLGRLHHGFLMRFLEKVDTIVCSSPQAITSSPYLQAFSAKCRCIPLGIDVKRFVPDKNNHLAVKKIRKQYGPRQLLFVGRLVYYKGLEYLVKAMQGIEAQLLIIGQGPLKRSLIKLAHEIGVKDKVEFLDVLSDQEIVNYYHACEVFVLPSIYKTEAYGLVQLEAMACAKPVVSTELSTGVSFVNQDNRTGLVVKPADHEALALAINGLLDDNGKREKMGAYAKERVFKEFDQQILSNRVLELYQELLSNV